MIIIYLYIMGAGILPTTIHQGTLYFLFGKENQYADTPGWSDFGGGTDNKESFIQTAIREGGEELTGFLGSDTHLESLLKAGTYNMDNDTYRMHIFYMPYNSYLPLYYNNNQRFLQSHLDASVIRNTKIFEKAEIRWISVHEIQKMLPEFRSYFQDIARRIVQYKGDITRFIRKSMHKNKRHTTKKPHKTTTRKSRKSSKTPKHKTKPNPKPNSWFDIELSD